MVSPHTYTMYIYMQELLLHTYTHTTHTHVRGLLTHPHSNNRQLESNTVSPGELTVNISLEVLHYLGFVTKAQLWQVGCTFPGNTAAAHQPQVSSLCPGTSSEIRAVEGTGNSRPGQVPGSRCVCVSDPRTQQG